MAIEYDEYFNCPYCGESNLLLIDLTGGSTQKFVVDCEICCAPIAVRLKISVGQITSLEIKKENE